jgi:hypothetical protein
MIVEFLEYTITPCSAIARSMGFLKSSIEVRARYRRCCAAWQAHLDHTRESILEAARLSKGRRKAVLFGAGLVHDIPIRELSGMFEEVVLVDIVHTISSRLQTAPFGNVSRISADVTETVDKLPELARTSGKLPNHMPQLLLLDDRVDFTVSVNLLSQLGWVPGWYLKRSHSKSAIEEFQRHLVEAHLEYLRIIPGHTALITDYQWQTLPTPDAQTRLGLTASEPWDVLHGRRLPAPDKTWDWDIAPAPERDPDYNFVASVAFFRDWKDSFQKNSQVF